jgi:hypothetical protein
MLIGKICSDGFYFFGSNSLYRHIVTNHLLHFLALDRSDPKKFEILQLIAALLKWTDGGSLLLNPCIAESVYLQIHLNRST